MILKTLLGGALLVFANSTLAATDNIEQVEEIHLDGVIAVVNHGVILQSDLDKSVLLFSQRAGSRGQALPSDISFQRQVLAHLVSQQVQLQLAETIGIRVADTELNEAMRNIARRNQQTLSEMRREITAQGGDYRRVRKEVRTEMLTRRLYERQVLDRIRISQQEIDDYLVAQAKSSEQQQEYSLQRILIGLREGASATEITAAKQLAESLVAQLRNGADFATLAIQHSTASEALSGGSIGTLSPNDMPGIYADAINGQAVGTISTPLRTTNGFHILRIADKSGAQRLLVTQSKVRHILLKTSAIRDEDATRDELANLRKRIKLGDNFETLARAHSEDALSAIDGGSMNWLSPGDMPGAFEQVVDSLRPGELSEPFRSPWGWHLVELLEQREQDQTEQRREVSAREALRERKAREEEESWRRRLLAEAYIEYRIEELSPEAGRDKL